MYDPAAGQSHLTFWRENWPGVFFRVSPLALRAFFALVFERLMAKILKKDLGWRESYIRRPEKMWQNISAKNMVICDFGPGSYKCNHFGQTASLAKRQILRELHAREKKRKITLSQTRKADTVPKLNTAPISNQTDAPREAEISLRNGD